jgi:hypothetical protein
MIKDASICNASNAKNHFAGSALAYAKTVFGNAEDLTHTAELLLQCKK